jgi:hypothetical protein
MRCSKRRDIPAIFTTKGLVGNPPGNRRDEPHQQRMDAKIRNMRVHDDRARFAGG